MAMTAHMDHPKLITLTLPRWEYDPRKGIQFLRKHINQLRKHAVFKCVKGGAYQIELKQKEDGWHIHVHMLLDTPYVPYQHLFKAWQQVTALKYASIDIRSAPTPEARAYVVKYPSKSAAFDTKPDAIVDWYEATKGLRLFATFGTWYNATMNELDPTAEPEHKGSPCPNCGERKTLFFIRDGPFIYGGEMWRKVESQFTDGTPLLKTIAGVRDIIKPLKNPESGPSLCDPSTARVLAPAPDVEELPL